MFNSENGISSIVGVLDDSKIFDGYKKLDIPVTKALVYCSFQTLSDRIAKRNEDTLNSGKFEDIRASTHPLFDFAKLFRPKTEEDDPKAVLEELDRRTVIDIFNSNYDAMKREMLGLEIQMNFQNRRTENLKKRGRMKKENY